MTIIELGLTVKQRDLLNFIAEKEKQEGVSPSYDEMRQHLELKSKSGISRLVKGLQERGCINRTFNGPRSISITDHGLRFVDPVLLRG